MPVSGKSGIALSSMRTRDVVGHASLLSLIRRYLFYFSEKFAPLPFYDLMRSCWHPR
jgi:hypothetical protein